MTLSSKHWIPFCLLSLAGSALTADPAQADPVSTCSGITERWDDVDFNDILRDDGEKYPNVRTRRHALMMAAKPGDFIAATTDITENDIGSGSFHAKNPELLIKKGEPLLHIECSERYGTHHVMTASLRYIRDVPTKLIDRAPRAFVFPDQPTLWEFDPHLAYVAASPEDLAAVSGAKESAKLEERCSEKALEACSRAANKVRDRPREVDVDAKADRACEIAKTRERNRCMGSAAGKKWEQNARKLDDLRRNREIADFSALKAKLHKSGT